MYVKEELIPDLGFVFESRDVVKLIGMSPILLNKFVERKVCGIRPSIRTGKGRGRRRLFNIGDLYAIATVYWLFRSGLRSQVISKVLRDITLSKRADANDAYMFFWEGLSLEELRLRGKLRVSDSGDHVLAIEHELGFTRASKQKVIARILAFSEVTSWIKERPDSSVQIIPVARLLDELSERAHALKPG